MNEQPIVDLDKELADLEKKLIAEALQNAFYCKTKAAKLLGISFRSFRYRLQKYGFQ